MERQPLLGPLSSSLRRHRVVDNAQAYAQNAWTLARMVLLSNYINVLLVFVPLGIVSHFVHWSATTTFVLNFLAIVPLASLLSFATEELAVSVGQTVGGLLNATFGNAVELIVSILALLKGELRIVQASMLGSILSNILLVLGCCFVAGGVRVQLPRFNTTVAQTMCGLMGVATTSMLIPAAFHLALPASRVTEKLVLELSRGTSVILLVIYALYLLFQLKTHASIYNDGQGDSEESAVLSPTAASIVLVIVTLAVSFCAEYLVDSIDEMVIKTGLSKTFVGLILLPIVGNAAEHVTAVVVSYKNKMDLAVGVAIGSSMQIALFVTPFLVILGWIIHEPLTLYFQTFETVIMFCSVLVVNYLIMDGETNYLEGAMLVGVYITVALAFYLYPDTEGV